MDEQLAAAREDGSTLPERGRSGYDSPGFAAAKAAARSIHDDARQRRN